MSRYSRNDLAGVELPKPKLDRESLRQALELFRYLRPCRARFGAALASLFAGSLLRLAFPYSQNTRTGEIARGCRMIWELLAGERFGSLRSDEMETNARLYHWFGGSGTSASERLSGGREPDSS